MEKKLCKSPQEVIEMVAANVWFAKKYIDDVQFSPEDAARTGINFLKEVIEVAVAEGATTINIPDTVGYSVGREFPDIIGEVKNLLKLESREAVISVHCHNDLGLAVSNTLAGIQAGARQAECCVMGLGERAGNAQLEAVVMAVKTRQDQFSVYTDIDTTKLFKTATLVSFVIGKPISDTLSIVGKNALSHGAGIHQQGVIKDSLTYEIMKPETVGWEGDSLPLVKHSGRKALEERLSVIGYRLSAENLNYFFEKFKLLADHKPCVYNEDLHLLMQECFVEKMADKDKLVKLKRVDYHRVDNTLSATVVLSQNNNLFEASGNGDGPIAAVANAIFKALEGPSFQLGNISMKRFNISKSGGGTEAMGLVNIEIENDTGVAYGRGSDTDVIVAFAKTMVSAINHLLQTPIQENNNDS
jgi:2-isopropylmalate synthase